ncbi:MAG: magnesium/cobalt transporter CorA [Planctomycetaceae bacterium]|nr:magnesium/cobalt transporter CorA [Planctomycetota bacterium]NUN52763.1 magnesium/cobalt transporter CorA [Planctomycetaceae bacterium]
MIRSFLWTGSEVRRDLPLPALKEALESRRGLLWVDFEDPLPEEVALLGPDLFGFHPLSIENCIQAQSRPKLDDYEDYLYLVFHSWNRNEEGIRLEEVDFFLGKNFLVSYHVETRPSIAQVMAVLPADPRLVMGHGADLLLHQVIDRMVDRYTVVVDALDERVDLLEDEVLEHPSEGTLKSILSLKRDLQDLFRTVRHQRDVLNSLAREGHGVISKRGRTFFRDVYDNVVRMHDTVEGLRDEVAGARDAYISMVSNRMNEVMKGLSTVATIILPLTFVTGVYGMNFPEMPLLRHPAGFWVTCGIMLAVCTAMFLAFRRKGWV